MNARTKKRLGIVTGIIVIVLAVILAVVGGGQAAKNITIEQAIAGEYLDQRIQVSGSVVDNSYHTEGDVLQFRIYDPEGQQDKTLPVSFDGGVAATFGNGVTAICTGKVDQSGVLHASELVTKCPSKYESGTDALTVERMLGYGDSIVNKTVRVVGQVMAGSQKPAGSDARFVLTDASDGDAASGAPTVDVTFDGALSDETLADGAKLVLTGNMVASGAFSAVNVAIQE